jgi:hypothetical protein
VLASKESKKNYLAYGHKVRYEDAIEWIEQSYIRLLRESSLVYLYSL